MNSACQNTQLTAFLWDLGKKVFFPPIFALSIVWRSGGYGPKNLISTLLPEFMLSIVPVDWVIACMVPLYKGKIDMYECSNFRGISLLSVVGKVYGRVLINRIRDKTENVIAEVQGGFRRGRGCTDQVLLLGRYARSIQEWVRMFSLHFWIWRKHMIELIEMPAKYKPKEATRVRMDRDLQVGFLEIDGGHPVALTNRQEDRLDGLHLEMGHVHEEIEG